MRKTLLLSAALLGLTAAAYAQGTMSGQSPAAPGAASQGMNPPNSMPMGSGGQGMSGADNSGTVTPAPQRRAMRQYRRANRMAGQPAGSTFDPQNPGAGAAPADQYGGVPPTSAYQGGTGSPRSNQASNITAGDTRSLLAPKLPDPSANGNTPQAYLAAARRALMSNQTGAAQEALERAETRVLTRSTDPSMANSPDNNRIAQAISQARQALANRNVPAARTAIDSVLGGT